MTRPEHHRSRTAWPGPMSIAGVGEGHSHDLPRPLVKRVRLLTQALVIVGGCMAAIITLLLLLIFLKGEQRDEENARMREQLRQGQCDLLDTFPEGVPALERARGKYHCGPGIPIEDLTPDEQARLQGDAPATTVQPPAVQPPTPDLGSPAVPNPPRPPANTPGPASPQPPAPEPEPTGPLDPITEPVCEATGICV